MGTIHDSMAEQGLVRPLDGRVLGGVCAGLGRRFGLTPSEERLFTRCSLCNTLLEPVEKAAVEARVPGGEKQTAAISRWPPFPVR